MDGSSRGGVRKRLVPGLKTIRTLGTWRQVRGWRVVSPKSHGSMSQPPPENDCIPVRLVTFMVCHRKGGCLLARSHEHRIFFLLVHACLHSVQVLSLSRDHEPRISHTNLCKTVASFRNNDNNLASRIGIRPFNLFSKIEIISKIIVVRSIQITFNSNVNVSNGEKLTCTSLRE